MALIHWSEQQHCSKIPELDDARRRFVSRREVTRSG